MTEHESTTSRQRGRLFRRPASETRPDPQHDAWVARTEALLFNFEEAAPAQVSPALGFVVMAADYLWAEQHAQADFAKLDVRAFTEACRELLSSEEALRGFAQTLSAFYQFLGARGLLDPHAQRVIIHELQNLPDDFTRPSLLPAPPS
jgi:hypothetical protein